MKSPFPYFGGKATVARQVWAALGQPKHYIEPFFGSGAVLLARPHWKQGMIETVNDADVMLCNVWRSLQFAPEGVARWCDWPVDHCELMARKSSIIKNEGRLVEGLAADPEFHDAKQAGYWIWAASCWIGSGLTLPGQIPHVSDGGKGVHALGQRPHVSNGGMGVHALGQRPHVSNGGMVTDPYNTHLYTWFRQLSERLRYVRVVCGDWKRVCGGSWQDKCGDVGIFMDPPYAGGIGRDEDIYHKESTTVAAEVNAWCLERGAIPSYRIVIAGYEEHENLLSHGWTAHNWKATGGYGNTSRNGADSPGNQNRKRETLYFSPHCLGKNLFDVAVGEGE